MIKKITQPVFCLLFLLALSGQFSRLYAQKVNLKATAATIAAHAAELQMTPYNLLNYRISDAYVDKASGATIAYLQQTSKGVDVFNAIKTVAFKDNKIFSVAGDYAADMAATGKTKESKARISAADAVKAAAQHFALAAPAAVTAIRQSAQEAEFSKLGISSINIKTKQLWLYDDVQKTATLTWQVQIQPLGQSTYWLVNVNAADGTVMSKISLTVSCDWQHPVNTNDSRLVADTSGLLSAEAIDTSSLPEGGAYRVIAYPAESPIHPGGNPRFDINPWKKAGENNPAVSFKWYADSIGTYDSSRSNNVLAQEDVNGNNGFGIGAHSYFPAPHLLFQRQPDLTNDPTLERNQQFAITNLFYWNNIMHDISYQYGFDEASGNFQSTNLDRGGISDDHVFADAQDGSGTDNANFSTPSDGFNPRMQMFLWSAPPAVNVLTPAEFSGLKTASESGFSTNNKLMNKGPITGEVVLLNDDATGTTHLGCGTVYNAGELAGKIALIDRGTCAFTIKVLNAQNAGAIAVIMVNNVSGPPITMGGTDNSITIPAVMISLETGDSMKTYLATQPPVTVRMAAGTRLDGDLDNGIIAHEYGHGISNRLTGGPGNVSCLRNAEQAGEGWSDYLALMVTTNWKTATVNDGANSRPIGTYVIGQPITGKGIRAYPYSTDLSINPWTYASMAASGGEVHTIGEIWCATVWDMTWDIIQQTGTIDGNLYNASSTGGNNIAMQLVIEGMKLQKCTPGFIDSRDGILKADSLLYGGQYSAAIWKAFARRGMGLYASQGSASSTTDQVADYTEPTPLMPIAKGSFTAAKQNNTTLLTWKGLTVNSPSAITVERSTDGKSFTAIGTTAPGSTLFTDEAPVDGNNTYRLSQTEKSGSKTFTGLQTVNFNLVSISPNPAKDFITVMVNGNTKPLTVTLLGGNGQKIATYAMSNSTKRISLPSLAKGVYYVSVTGENVSYKNKIIIQ